VLNKKEQVGYSGFTYTHVPPQMDESKICLDDFCLGGLARSSTTYHLSYPNFSVLFISTIFISSSSSTLFTMSDLL
jgi:hypothetical protein